MQLSYVRSGFCHLSARALSHAIETSAGLRTQPIAVLNPHPLEMPHISEAVGHRNPDKPVSRPEVYLKMLVNVLTNLCRSAGTLVTSSSTLLALEPKAQIYLSLLVRRRVSVLCVARAERDTLQNSVRDLVSSVILVVS